MKFASPLTTAAPASLGPLPTPAADRIDFPFSALVGQTQLQLALLLCAVDPAIGGVLIEGPRGSAKSTSARALAELLPAGAFINLPLGSSEEQLVGSLDLEVALQDGRVQFRPGLLAQAHEGVLYVDEVNLLADGLVDLLLDVCASGINRIERDGISHQHPACIALVGTMNPEEGELRPQLLDRFGLFVRVGALDDAAERVAIVRSRLAFDLDPAAFARAHAEAQQTLVERIADARERLPGIRFSEAIHQRVAALCYQAQVEGVRADLVLLRAARAKAALESRNAISDADLDAVVELALAHRRKATPQEATAPPPTGSTADHSADDARRESGRSDEDGSRDDRDNRNDNDDWGALPPQPAPIAALKALKPLRPFSAKKP